jgi:hypothetical protein
MLNPAHGSRILAAQPQPAHNRSTLRRPNLVLLRRRWPLLPAVAAVPVAQLLRCQGRPQHAPAPVHTWGDTQPAKAVTVCARGAAAAAAVRSTLCESSMNSDHLHAI